MEQIGKTLEHFPRNTQTQAIYDFPEDDPDYHPPSKEERRAEWLLRYLGVTDLDNTFANMKHPEGFEQTFKAFTEMADGASWYMLLVYGRTGNGKSLCCEALVIDLFDKGRGAKRERWADIVRHLKELMKTGGYEDYITKLRSRKTLILDDVGGGSTLGVWEWGELEDIVDYRLEQRLTTVITTNVDGKDIPERVISRFKDKTRARIICNKAEDFRPKKQRR